MYDEDDLLPLSALQHLAFCERQCALIHVEGAWGENRLTALGRVLHERTHEGRGELREGVLTSRSLPLRSLRLGLSGQADVVEFHPVAEGGVVLAGRAGRWQPFPVEYKRGKPKLDRCDEVQLCAQALCLEEMTGRPVPEGALFYAQTKRRVTVPFDAALRALTEVAVTDLSAVFASRATPPPTPHKSRCRACSLIDLCRPETHARPVRQWRDRMLARALA